MVKNPKWPVCVLDIKISCSFRARTHPVSGDLLIMSFTAQCCIYPTFESLLLQSKLKNQIFVATPSPTNLIYEIPESHSKCCLYYFMYKTCVCQILRLIHELHLLKRSLIECRIGIFYSLLYLYPMEKKEIFNYIV